MIFVSAARYFEDTEDRYMVNDARVFDAACTKLLRFNWHTRKTKCATEISQN